MQGALRALAENRKLIVAARQEAVEPPAAQDDAAAVNSVDAGVEVRKKSVLAESSSRLALTADTMISAARLGRELTATKNSKKREKDKERRRLRQARFNRRQLVRDSVNILRAVSELQEEEDDTEGDDRLPSLVGDDTSSEEDEPEGNAGSSEDAQYDDNKNPQAVPTQMVAAAQENQSAPNMDKSALKAALRHHLNQPV